MSISTVVTRGFGSWGTVNFLPTLGYSFGIGFVHGPFCVTETQVAASGATVQYAIAGADELQFAVSGAQAQIAVAGADEIQIAASGPTSVQGSCE